MIFVESPGKASRLKALLQESGKHRGCFQQPQGWSTRSNNEAETRDAPTNPANVGEFWMPMIPEGA
jgi:hypothetical protein